MTKFDKVLKKSYRMLSEAMIGGTDIPGMEGYDAFTKRKEEESKPSSDLVPLGMVPCEVEEHHTAWLVTFEDGKDILLQSDYDQAAFAASSADAEGNPIVNAPEGWDGTPSSLPGWENVSPEDIAYCLEDYLSQAEDGLEADEEFQS